MPKFQEALLAYLAAKDAKQTQVALDSMITGIKADIIQVVEETIAQTQSGGKSIIGVEKGGLL